jgi:lipopolysaccharide transport system ATP-binding protein
MKETVIEVKNLSKEYSLNCVSSYVTLRDKLSEIISHPFRLIEIVKSKKENFFALSDVNLQVERGEALGIIGPNGSGKSTLLKIISRVTQPSVGFIKIKGKLTSMLEVGTGFHPELTGRENILFSAAVLGMAKKETEEKISDIIEFSGIGKFIDMPVKKYSSGMYVRLAFAVAIHLESDIILIDEVLAVGDLEFQKKCLDKIDEINKNSDKTIIFVSHNLEAVQRICKRCLFLDKGKIQALGNTSDVLENYSIFHSEKKIWEMKIAEGNGKVRIKDFKITNHLSETQIKSGDRLKIEIVFADNFKFFKNCRFVIGIYDEFSKLILRLDTGSLGISSFKHEGFTITTEPINLASISCYANIALFIDEDLSERVVAAKRFYIINEKNSGSSDKPLLTINYDLDY